METKQGIENASEGLKAVDSDQLIALHGELSWFHVYLMAFVVGPINLLSLLRPIPLHSFHSLSGTFPLPLFLGRLSHAVSVVVMVVGVVVIHHETPPPQLLSSGEITPLPAAQLPHSSSGWRQDIKKYKIEETHKKLGTSKCRLSRKLSTKEVQEDGFIQCPERVFSGIQPTGVPHLGNYVGAISNWVKLQEEGNSMMVSIVDLHSITVQQDPAELRENIQTMAACLLACGIDSDKTILFQQSTDKSKRVSDPKVGLFTYPILQAADILLYKSTLVPVGEDQITHLELARDLARSFNRKYGLIFPRCSQLLGDVAKIRSLKDPSSKMSKSDPNPMSRIDLSDSPDEICDKIGKAVTDSLSKDITYDLDLRPGVANLIDLHSSLTGQSVEEIVKYVQNQGMNKKTYKDYLASVVNDKVQPMNAEMNRLLSDRGHLNSVLKNGQDKASSIAVNTMSDVMSLVGFR
ncbi:SYWM-like protein [Mya arenaria]|uniref:tryptophan--tRNA ligase n=1 Tax=Mya arenaria TaxID=6604 RepID=A0ABY7EK82_MYAAR|nr:SYWM-like protein [Mya arenaria]